MTQANRKAGAENLSEELVLFRRSVLNHENHQTVFHLGNVSMMKTVAIVNPVAGGNTFRVWQRLLRALPKETKDLVTWYTKGPGHAEILGREARRQGFERVIAGGGDGTLSQILNGLWWESKGTMPTVGMVALGTGCDYLRHFRTDRNPAEELVRAMRNPAVEVGVGMASVRGGNGRTVPRVFVNVLGTGYDANVAARLDGHTKLGIARRSYLLALLKELVRLKSYRFHGEIDGNDFQAESVLLVAGLGRYFGGGMMIAPNASPQAGHFQVVWSPQGIGRIDLLNLLAKVYRGRHLQHRFVRSCYARHLRLEASPPAYVEAEGEIMGRTPVEVWLSPETLPFVGA